MKRFSVVAAGLVLCVLPALAQDNLDGSWATVNGDLYGRARAPFPVYFGPGLGGIEEAWSVDMLANGSGRCGGLGALVFDSAGNVYLKTTQVKLSSVSRNGAFRWNAKDPGGADEAFGGFTGSSPVVGVNAVYATSGVRSPAFVGAWNKNTGARIWRTDLPENCTQGNMCTPVLWNGKLYVLGESNGIDVRLYVVNAATGAIEWSDTFDLFFKPNEGLTWVPNLFGANKHGLFFNVASGGPPGGGSDGFADMYAIQVDTVAQTADIAWQSDGGYTGHSHVIYNPANGRVYTATWNDFGASFYGWDALTGAFAGSVNSGYGHGFYDTSSLDWDDLRVVAGGFSGQVGIYSDDLAGNITVDTKPFTNWWGEYRVLQQLLQNCNGDTIMVSGTNSRTDLDPTYTARAVVLNITQAGGVFDDGPTYIDNIEYYDGASLVYSQNFNGLSVGDLDGQDNWVDDNVLPSGAFPVQVVSDPTGSGMGKVMEMNADGVGFGWQGIYRDTPDTTATTATLKFRQYRVDVTDNLYFAFGAFPNDFNDINGWGVAWDSDKAYHPWHFDGAGVVQTPDVWQTVTITYDFNTLTATVDIDGNTGPAIPMAAFFWSGINFQLEGTPASDNVNPAVAEYNTGINNNHGFTTHGGAVCGPDGKIYYSHRNSSRLVALRPVRTTACDTNCDGSINGQDIAPFVNILNGATPCCPIAGDANGDGSANGQDISGFIDCLAP